ncbi:bactofilin family protein [Nitrospira sp. M1]
MSDVMFGNLTFPKTDSYDEHELELYVSKGAHIHGVMHVKGMARIDGYFEGEIHTDLTLQIGEEAVIVADIFANRLISQGPIRGDVVAQQQVELLTPATVEGAISSPKFSFEQGVQVNAMIKMGKP